jgi:ankyrin repeat protein
MKITKRIGPALIMALALLAWSGIARSGEIHDAAQAGDVAKVKSLLAGNPDLVNAKDEDGATPLHLAMSKDVAELLLANKADVNAKDNIGYTPLHVAVVKNYKEVAELLRQHGGVE